MPTVTPQDTEAAPTKAAVAAPAAEMLTPVSILLSGHTRPVRRLAWSGDNPLLASAAFDWNAPDLTIRLWNTHGEPVNSLNGHTGLILSLAWSPDAKILASGSADQTVRLWDRDGKLIRSMTVGKGEVWSLAWSPDGNTLATGSMTGTLNPTVQLWRLDGTLITSMGTMYTGGKFYNLLWSPDGQRLLGGAIDYRLWRSDGSEVAYLAACQYCTPSFGAAWSPDSQRFGIGDENGELRLYTREGSLIEKRQLENNVDVIRWSPNNQYLAAGSRVWRADGTFVWGTSSRVIDLAWSGNSQYLAVAQSNRLNLVAADGSQRTELIGHSSPINKIAWSSTDLILATASDDQTVRLWRFPTQTSLKP
jgi:WD40 repeat protein